MNTSRKTASDESLLPSIIDCVVQNLLGVESNCREKLLDIAEIIEQIDIAKKSVYDLESVGPV